MNNAKYLKCPDKKKTEILEVVHTEIRTLASLERVPHTIKQTTTVESFSECEKISCPFWVDNKCFKYQR